MMVVLASFLPFADIQGVKIRDKKKRHPAIKNYSFAPKIDSVYPVPYERLRIDIGRLIYPFLHWPGMSKNYRLPHHP